MSKMPAKKQTKVNQNKKSTKPSRKKDSKKPLGSSSRSPVADEARVATQVIDLDIEPGADLLEQVDFSSGRRGLSLRLHTLNVRMPWLKVLLLVLLAGGAVVGVEELLRCNANPAIEPAPIARQDMPVEIPPDETAVMPETPKDELAPAPEESNQPASTEKPVTSQVNPPQANTGRKLVALTFDDGPSPTQTPRLLQILREKNVKVTFFVVGNRAQKSPEILRQEEAEGHEVASHTMTHANLKRSTVEAIKWEAAAMNGVFTDILGHGPSLTRPPYGNISNDTRIYINQPLILWTVDPEDWKYKDANVVHRNVIRNTFDGAIILMHDIHATTVDAVARVIDDLKAAGYEFMTVSELAAARGVVLQNGVSYGSFRP